MYNVGDRVLFSLAEDELTDIRHKRNVGLIIDKIDDEHYVVLQHSYGNYIYVVPFFKLDKLENVQLVRNAIECYYTEELSKLKLKLKYVTSEEKIIERKQKYDSAKDRILKNCEKLISCVDDDEFENRLKEITNLKKQLFAIDLECGDIIRKDNGKIKHDIKEETSIMNSELHRISDEAIEECFKFSK